MWVSRTPLRASFLGGGTDYPSHFRSFPGAVLGGLIAGELISLTSMINPAYSYVVLCVVMTLVLMFRPRGLLGAVGRE